MAFGPHGQQLVGLAQIFTKFSLLNHRSKPIVVGFTVQGLCSYVTVNASGSLRLPAFLRVIF